MSEKRFVQVGDTSIKDTLTGEKYYAPNINNRNKN